MSPPELVLVLGAAAVAYLTYRRATAARAVDRCRRHGHAPDPELVGTRRDRCRRCGARLR